MIDEETRLIMLKMQQEIITLRMKNTELNNQVIALKKEKDGALGTFCMMKEELLDILQMAATETLPLAYAQQAYAFYEKMDRMVDYDYYTHDYHDFQAELLPLLEELFDKYHPLTCEPEELDPQECKEKEEAWKKVFEITTRDFGPKGCWKIHICKGDGDFISSHFYEKPTAENNQFVDEDE